MTAPTRVAVALVAVVTLVGGALGWTAVAGAKARPATTTSTTTTTSPPLPAFDRRLTWSGCGDGDECATLTVPVDWSKAARTAAAGRPVETLPLALIRLPATSPQERVGTLVVNYGGPGESGIDALRRTAGRLPAAVREHFDVVSFDPRGTGTSRPVDCVDDADLDRSVALPPFPTTADQLQALHASNAQFAAGCVNRNGAYAGQVGSRNVARDVEAIRLALGEPKLDYLGYSYGTVIGTLYAQMFPTTVGRIVLDGPPDVWLDARDYAYQQAKGFMGALQQFLQWCTQSRCSLAASGNPSDVLEQLITRVDTQPLPASYVAGGVTRDGTLTGSALQAGVFAMLYDRSRGWPLLADALSQAVATGRAPTLLAIADQYLGRRPDGTWDPLVEANAVISCVDRPAKSYPSAATELADVQTFQSQFPPWGGSWGTASCVGMPPPAAGDNLADVRVGGSAPILVIGTTGDPATPYVGAEALTRRIDGSRLLTFDSTEHTAFARAISTCIDDTVDAYLVDGTLPPPGTHCAPD